MPSHSATALLSEQPDGPAALRVQLRLDCGCLLETTVPADRVIATVDGQRRAVGKYPCPLGHPVRRPG